MSDYRSIATIRRLAGAPVDHARELAKHSRGIPKPVVMVSYLDGHLFR